ncbi:zinc ribbon domain-containing protein [Bacillus sp. BGMRC 2118]|nr:zinc ribbon domain-containing protein [Bacillus sp. BGMRC 2118]
MYCNHCGTKNHENALYCMNDGVALKPVSDVLQLFRDHSKYCRNCRHENGPSCIYCMSCGQTLEKVREKEVVKTAATSSATARETNRTQRRHDSEVNVMNSLMWMRSGIFAIISVVILLVISAVTSSVVNSFLQEELLSDLGTFAEAIKLVSMTDIYMLLHMVSVTSKASLGFIEGSLQATSGLFLFLLIPGVIFTVMGMFLFRKTTEQSMIERLIGCFSFSLVYGVIVGITSLFAGASISIPDPSGFLGTIEFNTDYSFIESVFNAMVISFTFVSLGAWMALRKEQKLNNQGYGLSISRALLTTVFGVFLAMIAGTGIIATQEEESLEPFESMLLGSQAGGYLWNTAQFGTLEFETRTFGENIQASYSLLGGAKATEDEVSLQEFVKSFSWMLWLLVLIPIVLHAWAGRSLRMATQGNVVAEIGVYAVAVGIMNAILVSISRLSIDTTFDNAFYMNFGFSTIATFMISTFLAFVVAYGATFLSRRSD